MADKKVPKRFQFDPDGLEIEPPPGGWVKPDLEQEAVEDTPKQQTGEK